MIQVRRKQSTFFPPPAFSSFFWICSQLIADNDLCVTRNGCCSEATKIIHAKPTPAGAHLHKLQGCDALQRGVRDGVQGWVDVGRIAQAVLPMELH